MHAASRALCIGRSSPGTRDVEVVYLLVLLAVVLAGVMAWAFFWSVRSGQFDDLEGPAHRILMDDDEPRPRGRS